MSVCNTCHILRNTIFKHQISIFEEIPTPLKYEHWFDNVEKNSIPKCLFKIRIRSEMFNCAPYRVHLMFYLSIEQRFVPVTSETQGQTAAVSRMATSTANTWYIAYTLETSRTVIEKQFSIVEKYKQNIDNCCS